MTLNGQNVTFSEIKNVLRKKNFNDRPILSAAKCRPVILVSRSVRYMRIFAGWDSSGRGRQIQYVLYMRPNFHLQSMKKISLGIIIVWSSKLHKKLYPNYFFQACLYTAHRRVIFAVAQLCLNYISLFYFSLSCRYIDCVYYTSVLIQINTQRCRLYKSMNVLLYFDLDALHQVELKVQVYISDILCTN